MDTRRIVLRALLQKMLDGTPIPEDVRTCVKNISDLYDEFDTVLQIQRDREQTSWTESTLDVVSLKQLGNFKVTDWRKKNLRIVSFSQSGVTLKFFFEKTTNTNGDLFTANDLRRMMNSLPLRYRLMQIGVVDTSALIWMMKGFGRKSFGYGLSDDESMSLSQYELREVRKVSVQSSFFGLTTSRAEFVVHQEKPRD